MVPFPPPSMMVLCLFSPMMDRALSTKRCSWYVPALTKMVSPRRALFMASWMVV